MSELVPSVVPLSAGLSLQVPKLMAPSGSLLDVLNYEQVDMQGQKRIDGYVRYDGSTPAAFNDFYTLDELPSGWTVEQGTLVNEDKNPVGIWLDNPDSTVIFPINYNLLPPGKWGKDEDLTVEEHYEQLLSYLTEARLRVEQLPGAVAGLHWFRDRLYAVADLPTVTILSPETPVKITDVISTQGVDAVVLDYLYTKDGLILYIDSVKSEWSNVGEEIYHNGELLGTITDKANVINPFNSASIFESRSESQVLSEDSGPYDFGWRFVHLGWSVPFSEGLSLYGGLPALNQNLGAIGAGWSTTGGNNGSPLVLTQSVNLSNGRRQVNGWKNSNTPTNYSLSPSNITTTDSSYIYADAYVSWDGASRVINVPKDNLTEQSPTATIEVDV